MGEQTEEGQISKLIDYCLIRKDIENYEVESIKSSEKGEGYNTKVVFVIIKGTKKSNGGCIELDLVFKVSRVFHGAIKNNMRIMYKTEMLVYENVFPVFKLFTKGKMVNDVFNSVPQLFKTFSVDGRDIVVLENLKSCGYEPHDRMSPMNFNHIKLILKNYARFHAISYAYRDQRPSEFENHFSDYPNVYRALVNEEFKHMYQLNMIKAQNLIKEIDSGLANKMNSILDKGSAEILEKIFDEHVEESVITHGDCWNSNFLFKYENGDKASPTNAIILDWQISSLHSPVIDLSYFFFAVSSAEQTAKFEELLKYYHEHLSESIRELGSDPDRLFSFSKFYEHWKKYCVAGLIFTITFLDRLLSNTDDLVYFDDVSDPNQLVKIVKQVGTKYNKVYLERILATTKYYFDLMGK